MDPDDPEHDGFGRRQRLATGIVIGMSIGVALSLAVDDWGMLVIGIAMCVVFWAGFGSSA